MDGWMDGCVARTTRPARHTLPRCWVPLDRDDLSIRWTPRSRSALPNPNPNPDPNPNPNQVDAEKPLSPRARAEEPRSKVTAYALEMSYI